VDLRQPQPQPCLASSCLAEARVQLRMVRCPGNMPWLYRGRRACESCGPCRGGAEETPVSTQEHLRSCRAYGFLQQEHREMDGDFRELTKYFMDLMWVQA
jgi:hypothetical protein